MNVPTDHACAKIVVPLAGDLPKELVLEYLCSCQRDLSVLKAALTKGGCEHARVFGHQLKGTGQPYGFAPVTRLGAAIERAAVRGDARELEDLAGQLEVYLSRVEIAGE